MTRDEFIKDMLPSFTAMRAKMGKRDQLDMAFVAGKVFDQLQLSGWILTRKPPPALHHTPAAGMPDASPQTQKGPPA